MRQALHIFRKDLRRLKWWLAVWVILLGLQTVSAILAPPLALSWPPAQILIPQIDSLTAAAIALMLALIVARLVHEEPLVGLDWFWISRPYDWRSLFGAKLLSVVLFFVGLPLVAHVFIMIVFSARPADMVRAIPSFIAVDFKWVLGWMVLAVLTRSLATFSLAVVGTLAATVLLIVGTLSVVLWTFTSETPPDPKAPLADASGSVIGGVVFLIAALGVIAYAYRNRRLVYTLLLTAAGLAAVVIVPMFWPWRFAAVWPVDFTRDAHVARSMRVALDFDAPRRLEEPSWPARERATRVVQVPVQVDLPPDFRIQGTFAQSQLAFADGHVIRSAQRGGYVNAAKDAEAPHVHPLQGMFPGVRVLPISREPSSIPTMGLITANDEEIGRYGSQPGRLTGTTLYEVSRLRIAGAMPVTVGAAFRDGWCRVEILAVECRRNGCSVSIRHWRTEPLWSASPFRTYEFVLRNAGRREAIAGDHLTPQEAVASGTLPFFALGMIAGGHEQSGFDVRYTRVDYPSQQESAIAAPPISREWLADAELVVVESTSAGWLTKTITVEGFQMQPVTMQSTNEARP